MPIAQAAIASSNTAVLTVPANQQYDLGVLILCSTSASSDVVTGYLVQSGGAAGTANQILSNVTVNPYETQITSLPVRLSAGDSAVFIATSGSRVTATISYAIATVPYTS